MNNGKLEHIGKPYDLVSDWNTVLFQLVNSLGRMESDRLIEIARIAKINQKPETDEESLFEDGNKKIEESNSETTEREPFLKKNFSHND